MTNFAGDSVRPMRSFFIEKTIVAGVSHRQYGELKLGASLLSPQRYENGADGYKFMRAVKPGDVILHLIDNEKIEGFSFVAAPVEDYRQPHGTIWYRVPLTGHTSLTPALHRRAIFCEATSGPLLRLINSGVKNLFFTRNLSLSQGAYLTPASDRLIEILGEAYHAAYGISMVDQIADAAIEKPPL